MKRTMRNVAVLLGVFIAGVATADITIVYLSASAQVDKVIFESKDAGANIYATVCGHTLDSLGNVAVPKVACDGRFLQAGAFKTQIASIFTGNGLTAWKNVNGL